MTRAFAPLDFAQLIAAALIWGLNNILAKIAVDAMPPLLVLALRFSVVLIAVGWMIRPLPKAHVRAMLSILVLVGPLHMGIQYVGLAMAHDLAPMVVAMQLWVPASVVFAALVLKERVSPLRQAGVGLAFVGVVAMTFDPVVFAQLTSLVLMAIAAACYGLGAVLVRREGAGLGPWVMQAWIALMTVPVVGAGSALFERGQIEAMGNASWLVWGCILFAALGSSVLANAFVFRLMQRYEVSRITPYMLLSPPIAFVLGWFILGDVITARVLLGGALTMGGVVLVALAERRFRAKP